MDNTTIDNKELEKELTQLKKENANYKKQIEDLEKTNKNLEKTHLEEIEKISKFEGKTIEEWAKEHKELHEKTVKEAKLREEQEQAIKKENEYKTRFEATLGDKKLRDDLTHKALFGEFKAKITDENNKGKGDKDIFEELTINQNYFEVTPELKNTPSVNDVLTHDNGIPSFF